MFVLKAYCCEKTDNSGGQPDQLNTGADSNSQTLRHTGADNNSQTLQDTDQPLAWDVDLDTDRYSDLL